MENHFGSVKGTIMTLIVLIANYWTPHTPGPMTYALTYVGDLVFIIAIVSSTRTIRNLNLNMEVKNGKER